MSDSQDIYCVVDERDYVWVTQWNWNYLWKRFDWNPLYARRNVGPARNNLYLHRELMLAVSDLPTRYTDTHVVDHVNGNTLDNRRANLRWATLVENRRNRHYAPSIPSLAAIVAACPTLDVAALPF